MTNLERLELLKSQLSKLQESMGFGDEMAKHFHGGKVGFLNGSGLKKFNRSIDKSIGNAVKMAELREQIKQLEAKINYVKPIEKAPSFYKVGDVVQYIGNSEYTVLKINKKTVTIGSETYKEAVNPNCITLIKPVIHN